MAGFLSFGAILFPDSGTDAAGVDVDVDVDVAGARLAKKDSILHETAPLRKRLAFGQP